MQKKKESNVNVITPRILVVDDDSSSLFLMRKVLSAENFLDVDVDIFQDSKKAQVSYQTNEYDVLIVDLRMPVLSGFDILKDLQDNHEKKAAVIVLTANVEEGTENRALKLGARKVFHKPFYIPDFVHEVKTALKESAVTN